jgi:manganese/zinc/iron transport system permease protein
MIAPYAGKTFFDSLLLLLSRFWHFIIGDPLSLASDELQLLVLIGVSASSALIGTFLVLRKMVMLANSLSHTILIGIILSYLLMLSFGGVDGDSMHLTVTIFLLAALLTGILTTFLTQYLSHTFSLYEDASNGFVFSFLFALGVILATLFTRNSHVGTELIMGNVDALHNSDLVLVAIVLAVNCIVTFIFYRLYWVSTFDTVFASTLGVSTTALSYLLMTQVSATTVSGFRAVGVLMVLAFIVVPPLVARMWTHRLWIMLALSVVIGIVSTIIGVLLSRHLLSVYCMSLSTSGLVVTVLFIGFIISLLFSPNKGVISNVIRSIIMKKKNA